VCLASLAFSFWQGLSRAPAAMDIRGYLAMGAAWRQGLDPYLPSDPVLLARFGVSQGWGFGPALPHGLPLFALLSEMGNGGAGIALWILSFVAFGASMFLLVRWVGREWTATEAWLFVAILAQSRLNQSVAYRGQLGLILLLPMLLAVWLDPRRHPFAAGACLALTLIKPTLALPLIGLFLVRRAWLALGSGAAITAAASVAAAVPLGVREIFASYAAAVDRWTIHERGEWAGSWHVTSWQAIVYDALGAESRASAIVGFFILAVAAGGIAWLAWRSRTRTGEMWTFAALLLFAQFGSYHRVYDGVPVFVVAALLWSRVRRWPARTPTAPEVCAALLTVLFLFVLSSQAVSERVASALAVVPTGGAVNAWVTALLLACVILVGLEDARHWAGSSNHSCEAVPVAAPTLSVAPWVDDGDPSSPPAPEVNVKKPADDAAAASVHV
jgi:hypothetical protein